MKRLGRNCYNCIYMDNHICCSREIERKSKYSPVTGTYISSKVYPIECSEIVGTRHCKWSNHAEQRNA